MVMSFWSELKRRNVYKVGVAYALVAWIIAQVVDVVDEPFGLPIWFDRTVLVMLIGGFPVALFLAWVYDLTPAGIRRTDDIPQNERIAQPTSRKLNYLLIGLVGGAVIGTATFWLLGRDVDAAWMRDEAGPELESLIAAGNWEAAFSLAKEAQARVGDDPELDQIWPRISWRTTIASDPPGATVYRRGYDAPESDRQKLGETPLENIRIPFGLSRLEIELEGFVPLSRTIGGGTLSPELAQNRGGPLNMRVGPDVYRLDTRESLPEGKVRVPGWTEVIEGQPAEFHDFFLDRTEVTNRQFKAFVEAGGYRRRELWEPIVRDGAIVPWEQAMALFTDRTGRPGPATWVAGDFPEGRDDFPVSGVSWYEAAAYARFMGQELPTAYHWRHARAEAAAPWLLAVSNVDSDGPRAVTESRAMSYVGAYDMDGNVREWTATARADEFMIAGGSWNDEAYVAAQPLVTAAPPLDRSPANGFRLAITTDEPAVKARAAMPFQTVTSLLDREPVSEETYAAYSQIFAYDDSPLNASIDAEESTRLWTRQRITFDAAYGRDRMVLYLYLPKKGAPPYQTVIYWPTSAAYLLDSIDDYQMYLDFVVSSGRAVAFPVYSGTFERHNDRGLPFAPNGQVAYRDDVIEGVNDLRRSIDYFETRPDIDTRALAYFGHSQGGINAPIVLAQEPRLRVGIVYVGFVPDAKLEPSADPVNALPRVNVPVLLLSGEFDSTATPPAARRFFELIGTPEPDKKQVVAPGAHFVERDVLVRETLNWLNKYLGPVRES